MNLQTTVGKTLISGIPGEISHDGPTRAITAAINTTAEENNVFGRAFTYADKTVESVQAGGTGTFAGILVHPKAYAIDSDTLANGDIGEFLQMGEIYVSLTNATGVIGNYIQYNTGTGALSSITSTTPDEGHELVPNAAISRHNPSPASDGAVLAVIRLTN